MGTTIFITKVGCLTLKPAPDICFTQQKKTKKYFRISILQPLPALCDELGDRRKAFSYDYSYDSTNKGNATYASQEKVSSLMIPFCIFNLHAIF